jgi:1-pyrroline-5-carboxylate dehydrogenase
MNLPAYQNEAYTDYTIPEHNAAYRAAIVAVRAKLAQNLAQGHPLVIGSERIFTAARVASVNPGNPREVIGYTASATADHAEQALDAAWQAFESWKNTPVSERVAIIVRAAALIRERKLEFNALLTLEIGKNYGEAEGETAEAIDFLEYYARQALKYGEKVTTYQMPGGMERNHAEYIPLGAGVSISPWNFALAIFLGQAVAPIVAGNTVIVKPSEDSGVVAAWAVDLLLEAGLPAGVINFLPGDGRVVGEALVTHPKTRFINFTGSKAVGLHINAEAAKVLPGQKWIKRVSLELGGKDGMIVDETADLDQAAAAAVAAAFGFAGQKCSALSRLIVVESVYPVLLEKVVARVARLGQGQAEDNSDVNAVINQKALDKTSEYLALGPIEGRVVAGGSAVASGESHEKGYFVTPTVIADVAPTARLAQDEIFGPVLAVIPVKDFDEALAVVNNTDYGLTGGLFSNDQARLARAEAELHVGNLYLNRKITGAMVGVHPFGGFNLSGTDSKAGGPDYLGLFLQMKSIARYHA